MMETRYGTQDGLSEGYGLAGFHVFLRGPLIVSGWIPRFSFGAMCLGNSLLQCTQMSPLCNVEVSQ